MLRVFKFGGASVKDAAAIKNMAAILKAHIYTPLVVVVSAMGKTTNALEEVARAYFEGNSSLANQLLSEVRRMHETVLLDLYIDGTPLANAKRLINTIWEDLYKQLNTANFADFDFVYDQIVSRGELLSTKIISNYIACQGIDNKWLDVRKIIKTNNVYREAQVHWEASSKAARNQLIPLLHPLKKQTTHPLIITQGFIGGTREGFTTTLGREGSDFTAAILANLLHASEVCVWKDVPGILTADPRLFADVEKIDYLSYYEAIEMAFYGAKVIHPKTLKPLQNANISLRVCSFVCPDEPGTLISNNSQHQQGYLPVRIIKPKQILISVLTTDYSFMAENTISELYKLLATHHIKANLMQTAALSFSACLDDDYKIPALLNDLKDTFSIKVNTNLQLICLRHYTPKMLHYFKQGYNVLVEQRSRNTALLVVEADCKVPDKGI